MSETHPTEIITEVLCENTVLSSKSLLNFVGSLDANQRIRFSEVAHHLVAVGYDEALNRTGSSHQEAAERINTNFARGEMEKFMEGVALGIRMASNVLIGDGNQTDGGTF